MASRVVRRLDSLGRIVIPKEVRKDLNIKGNEKVEISVVDDKIVLSRYSDIKSNNNIQSLIDNIYLIFEKDVIITNLNNIVLTTSNYSNYLNLELNSEFINNIEARKDIYEYIPTDLNLTSESIKASYFIKPIIVNGDCYGLLILLSKFNLDNNDLKIVNFLVNYLIEYLE